MEVKYRVKQIGNKFYPQYKKFLFWRNCLFKSAFITLCDLKQIKNNPIFTDGVAFCNNKEQYYGKTLNEAQHILDTYIKTTTKLKYKKHKICKVCKRIIDSSADFTYIDLSIKTQYKDGPLFTHIFPVFGNTLGIVTDKIDEIEKFKEIQKIRKIFNYKNKIEI